jgi:hypothetical protein
LVLHRLEKGKNKALPLNLQVFSKAEKIYLQLFLITIAIVTSCGIKSCSNSFLDVFFPFAAVASKSF